MIKIHQLFLRLFTLLFLFLLVAISLTTYYWSKSIYIKQIEHNLSQNIDTFSTLLINTKNLDSQVKNLKNITKLRITVINDKGIVIAESDKDKNSMENHLKRYEILRASKLGVGKKIRFSNTINKELLYVAKRVNIDGRIHYIRMAAYIEKISENFISLSFQIFAIVSLFLIISFYITYKISNKIKSETNNILDFLINVSNKKYTNIHSSYTLEFNSITRYLNLMAKKLSKKDKLKNKQNAKLKLANRQKDQIISAISHEFKNPIAIISGYTQTILSDNDLSHEIKTKFLNKISSNANKMTSIIDTLRLSLRLEDNKQKLSFKKSNINRLCNEIISDLQAKYLHREINVSTYNLDIEVDEILFSIVLNNLIENALKYSDDTINIILSNDSIIIEDFGIGISKNDMNLIKHKFYRVSNNEWNNSLGLGLFIVDNIVKIHKFIWSIESEISKGTRIIIKFNNKY